MEVEDAERKVRVFLDPESARLLVSASADTAHKFRKYMEVRTLMSIATGAIVDAAWAAWRKLIADPDRIKSIGLREWAHIGQPSDLWLLCSNSAKQLTETRKSCPLLRAGNNHIDHPVKFKIFRTLKAFWQPLPNGLLNDS